MISRGRRINIVVLLKCSLCIKLFIKWWYSCRCIYVRRIFHLWRHNNAYIVINQQVVKTMLCSYRMWCAWIKVCRVKFRWTGIFNYNAIPFSINIRRYPVSHTLFIQHASTTSTYCEHFHVLYRYNFTFQSNHRNINLILTISHFYETALITHNFTFENVTHYSLN